MPKFSDIDLWSFVALALPGLILVQGYALGREYKLKAIGKDDLVIYPVFSLLYGLWLWFWGYAVQTGQSIFTLEPRQILLIYMLMPFGIGLIAGAMVRFDIVRRILALLGVPMPKPPEPIRTPWPVVIPKIRVGTYLMVALKDGTRYRALVTEDSAFSTDPDKIDIYLGQIFEGENWTPTSPQRSVYLRGTEIQSIEIWRPDTPQTDNTEV